MLAQACEAAVTQPAASASSHSQRTSFPCSDWRRICLTHAWDIWSGQGKWQSSPLHGRVPAQGLDALCCPTVFCLSLENKHCLEFWKLLCSWICNFIFLLLQTPRGGFLPHLRTKNFYFFNFFHCSLNKSRGPCVIIRSCKDLKKQTEHFQFASFLEEFQIFILLTLVFTLHYLI